MRTVFALHETDFKSDVYNDDFDLSKLPRTINRHTASGRTRCCLCNRRYDSKDESEPPRSDSLVCKGENFFKLHTIPRLPYPPTPQPKRMTAAGSLCHAREN